MFPFLIFITVLNRITPIVVKDLNLFEGKYCTKLLEDYAGMTANFTKCFIEHARPITVCQNCIEDYMSVLNSYKQIMNLIDGDTGEVCKMILVNVDRLEVVEASFNYVKKQWKKASCDKCFQINSTKLDSETVKILNLHTKIEECENNVSVPISYQSSNSVVCTSCETSYLEINRFYDENGAHSKFCMDIVDMINSTRFKWSITFGCYGKRAKSHLLFFIIASTVCSFPVIFYCVVWLHSRATLLEFTQQSRWTQRFQRLSSTS